SSGLLTDRIAQWGVKPHLLVGPNERAMIGKPLKVARRSRGLLLWEGRANPAQLARPPSPVARRRLTAPLSFLSQLYENFISEFEHRVNPLSLVEIILHVVRQMTDPNVALTFLEKTREKVKSSDEAVILCKTAIGALKLNIGDLQVTKETIEDVEEMLNNLPGVTSVHSRFYDLSSKYYQTIGNHASYYKDALRFLGCIDVKDLPVSEQQERAFTLGLAGLLGEGVYNFGELLMHPVLDSLRNTDRQWLIDTLYAFNSGNVERFQTLKPAWGQQPDLAANEALLLQKIQLLCLMEMTFTRPANHRQLTFEEIAQSAKVKVNEVELLVMKALSVGLVKGSIDEVDKRVHMTWVQPRVLDVQQVQPPDPLAPL
ncbi:26S proteasome non-ATPase regulatory subunit 13, partial [Gracilinanus agilis]|uniref:26S proteasome non-ATPase regulatory subunit 13 n=1 Tax=Gracilinanus agilis TaxID=191870 RepID=UPI001CFDC6BB